MAVRWVHGKRPVTLDLLDQISPCNINTLYTNRYKELLRA